MWLLLLKLGLMLFCAASSTTMELLLLLWRRLRPPTTPGPALEVRRVCHGARRTCQSMTFPGSARAPAAHLSTRTRSQPSGALRVRALRVRTRPCVAAMRERACSPPPLVGFSPLICALPTSTQAPPNPRLPERSGSSPSPQSNRPPTRMCVPPQTLVASKPKIRATERACSEAPDVAALDVAALDVAALESAGGRRRGEWVGGLELEGGEEACGELEGGACKAVCSGAPCACMHAHAMHAQSSHPCVVTFVTHRLRCSRRPTRRRRRRRC